ncbi:MAG: protein kinase [Pseudomonadales bacterium]
MNVLEWLEEALQLPPAQRRRYLTDNAPPAQRDKLLAMLELAEQATSAMPTAALRPSVIAPVDRTGEQLGPYRIRETIGRGGMGEVYLAERNDGVVDQQVAIKVIGLAAPGERVRRQFQMERQILADLQHPGITTLLDGGTTADGLPYVVMERVSGLPLDRYLEQAQPSLDDRLRLFLDIADAIAYAHRHLIVHGDLKPSNILVTEDGRPKLLDFGIARPLAAAEHDGDPALAGLMTASYASPEQARGELLTVASDIYALGLLLYETLTGERFHDLSGLAPAAVVEQLSTVPAPAASAVVQARDRRLARHLRGDLDAIIGNALAIEPTRRYSSVTALCDDVQRYRSRQPVSVRAGSRLYRAGRFCRRNWIGVGAATAIALSLGIATMVSAVQADIARTQRDVAAREAATAEDAVQFLQSMLFSANPWEGIGNERTLDDVLDYAEDAMTDAFAERPESRVYLLSALGEVFVGRGDLDKGLDYAQQAVALAERATDVSELRRAAAHRAHGRAALDRYDVDTAIAAYERALAILDAAGNVPAAMYASLLNDLGTSYSETDDTATAEAYYRRSLDHYQRPGTDDPEGQSSTLSNLAQLLINQGDLASGDRLLSESIRLLKSSGAGDAKHGMAVGNRASLLVRMDRLAEADDLYQEAVERLERGLGDKHPDTLMMMTSLGYLYLRSGEHGPGATLMAHVLERADGVLEPMHPVTAYVQNVAGALHCKAGQFERGRGLLQTSLDTRRALHGDANWSVASSMSLLGECLLLAGDRGAAQPLLVEGHARLEAELGPEDERTRSAAARLSAL